MSQKIIGLDLGEFSVKAVVVNMGFRGSIVEKFDEEPVVIDALGIVSDREKFLAAGRLMRRLNVPDAVIHVAVPGEGVSIKTVQLPASAARQLDSVLKFELDEELPFDIEEAVFDHVTLNKSAKELILQCAVAPVDGVERYIDGLAQEEIDPREIGVAPLCYGMGLENDESPVAVVDLGFKRTNVSVVGDRIATQRTVLRGGFDLTGHLAKVGKVSFGDAEQHKINEGLTGKVGEVLKVALRPLVREIRQTLSGHLARGGGRVSRLLICGGGALLKGIDSFLADEIGVAVELYGADVGVMKSMNTGIKPASLVLAHSLAKREENPRSKRVNLRRGVLSFKKDYQHLVGKVVTIAVYALLLLGSWVFSSWVQFYVLEEQANTQKEQLATITKDLFQQAYTVNDKALIEKIMGGGKSGKSPMPEVDAFDIVIAISERIPENVVHDVTKLSIKPKRIVLSGIVNSELKSESAQSEMDENDTDGETSQPGGLFGPNPMEKKKEQSSSLGEDPLSTLDDNGSSETALSPTDLIIQKLSEYKECFTKVSIEKVNNTGTRKNYDMVIESLCP